MSHRTSHIYQEALAELRDRHPEEFEEIRQAIIRRSGIEVRQIDPIGARTACLQVLAGCLDAYGRGPSSFQELGEALGVSWNAARRYCNTLETEGWITRDHGAYRSAETIRLTSKTAIVMGRRTA
jgi:SOS-response transcriptional repressor LexA